MLFRLKTVAAFATGMLLGAISHASLHGQKGLGADDQGALHFGELTWIDAEPKMQQDVLIEFYNKTDHWRIQRQRNYRGWEGRTARVEVADGTTTSQGAVGKSEYILRSSRVSSSAFKITWEVDSRPTAEYYRNLNEVGAVLVFYDDEGTQVFGDGKRIDYELAPERSQNERKLPQELAIEFASAERFVLSDFEGFSSWDIIRTRGQVLLTLRATKTTDKGIEYGFILATANAKSNIASVPQDAFQFHHNQDGWFLIDAPENKAFLNSPSFNFVDVSGSVLDAPAGKHGFLQVRDGHFYFENGIGPVRLSGLTLVHGSKFPTKAEAEVLAQRIAAMGSNLLRLHHIDYFRSGFGLFDQKEFDESTQNFDADLMDRMDYLIYQLKLRGVYIHMDGLTARKFRPADGVAAYDQLTFGLKGTAYIYENDVLLQKQKEFLKNIWTHYNPYTGLEYRNDPVFVTTEIVNENDLFTHGSLGHHFPKPYRTQMEAMFAAWSKRNGYGSTYTYATAPKEISGLYSMDTMRNYYRIMYMHLRDLGVRIPISGTNWIPGSLGVIAAQREMDYTADHPYGTDDYYRQSPLSGQSRAGLLSLPKIQGKPLVHNEWNVVNVTGITRAATFLYQMALMSSAGHDASYLFALFHHSKDFNAKHIHSLDIGFDPAMRALYPAAALLLIRGDMTVSDVEFSYTPDLSVLLETTAQNFDSHLNGFSAASFWGKTAIDYTNIPLPHSDIPFQSLFPQGQIESLKTIDGGSTAMFDLLPEPNDYIVRNFSGELVSHWKERWFMVKTPKSKWLVGYPPANEAIDLGDGVIVTLKQSAFACITITALDDKPITQSEHLMVVTVSDVEQPEMYFDRRWQKPNNLSEQSALICRPTDLTLILPTTADTLWIQHKGPNGEVLTEDRKVSANGSVSLRLDGAVLAYEIRSEKIANK